MGRFKLTYFIAISTIYLFFSCKQTKYVADGSHLLSKNEVIFTDEKIDIEQVTTIIRQQPNHNFIGIKLKLYIYNSIDSAKVAKSHDRVQAKIKRKNLERIAKQDTINKQRIARGRARGDSLYTERIIPLKDTTKLSFREWIKYKRGEKPVIFDSAAFVKSTDQLQKFLQKKGYFYGHVTSEFKDNKKNTKKRTAIYTIHSGEAYYIDTFVFDCKNEKVLEGYKRYLRKQVFNPLLHEKFDENYLDEHRYKVTKYMRDNSLFGFSPSNITFEADTNRQTMKLKLIIHISDRQFINKDSVYFLPFQEVKVKNVYFHIIDTNYYQGNYIKDVLAKDLLPKENGFLRTFDTLEYRKIFYTRKEVKNAKKDGITITTKMLNPFRFATILYNGKPAIRPSMIELQNYLENDNWYKEYYIDRSYTRMMQLDVFQTIKPVIKEIAGTNKIEVHYFLVTAKKQSYKFEQRFSNSSGFLGLAASLNYNNKNLFHGSEKLTISFGGGFESQPPVFETNLDGEKDKKAGRSFNTFEIGPSIKLDLPGLFLLRRATKLSKRHRPRTVISTAYNYQKRTIFSREIFQFNYLWKFYMGKTQIVQVGVPAAAIKYVKIDPSADFKAKLEQSNNLFLKNSYSNQFIWENLKLLYEYSNKNSENRKKTTVVYNASFVSAGWLLSKFNLEDTSSTGQKEIFGVAYSRFLRFDNDVIVARSLNRKTSLHARVIAGFGVPRGNKTTSLPYDYSFFAGGSNDNRGWRARELGPGAYKYYLDTNKAGNQIGDIRIGMFGEVRYSLSPFLKTAFFVDAGNIWTYENDANRPGSQFSKKFYKEIALTTGFGLRFDATFLIVRIDIGFPLTNPALPDGAKWVFQSRKAYYDEGILKFGQASYKELMPKPFSPSLNFGIGYPF